MATVTKAVLKTYFEQGDIPTQGQYVDLIDSQFGLGETGTQIIQGTISASQAKIEYITLQKLSLAGLGVANDDAPRTGSKVGSTFTIGKTLEISGSMNVKHGNIRITASGEFQGENATITNISGSFLSASGHIYSAGNITASGHISGSATSTGSFGRVEVATRIEHAQDENTSVNFGSDHITINANDIQGAKFSSTKTNIGNTSYPTSITGSTISLSGDLTASNAVFSSTVRILGTTSASLGINATDNSPNTNVTWSNTGFQSTARRSFTLTISSLPTIFSKNNFSIEYMAISNSQITTTSVVIVNQAAFVGNGEHTQLMVSNVRAGFFKITPYSSTITDILAGGSATYNFVIL